MKPFIRYFLQGLLILVPISITIYVVVFIVLSVGSLLHYLDIHIHPIVDPFIGFMAVVLLIWLVGILGSTLLFKSFANKMDTAIERAPFVKIIYSSVKDLLSAFVGTKKRFNRPVLVIRNKEAGIQQLGFITRDDLSELNIKSDKVVVYVPNSYSLSGTLLIVPKENIVVLDNVSATEAMKFIISGGVTDID